MKKKRVFKAGFLLSLCLLGASFEAMADPHFYLQMENRSLKDATISFRPDGNVRLDPVLGDETPLKLMEQSKRYGVIFEPLGKNDKINIIFKGKQECTFNIAFFAPGNPKVNIQGHGCFGGGYQITGNTVVLYISDINLKQNAT